MSDLPFEPIVISDIERREISSQVQDLVKELELASTDKRKKGAARKSQHAIYNCSDGRELTSWKFQEWDYGRTKIQLPSNARGLFTMFNETSQLYEIIIRGYDKFFSVGEMESVSRKNLLQETQGPYSLSIKSNGCIAFISGLEDGTLVVCSKHATGVVPPTNSTKTIQGSISVDRKNHALAAQLYLEKQLHELNIEVRQLALMLYKMNVTAVAEYCDDEFEEHVLEYSKDKSGLYLHGLNLNAPEFVTYPLDKVALFAKMFGFKETKYLTYSSLSDSFEFLDECAKTGTFNNEEIEGFVIRCKRDGKDYLFKYKFEEPYMLYRRLREVTKTYITDGYDKISFGAHKLVCIDYLKLIIPILEANPDLKQRYMENKCVIELRKKYFEMRAKSAFDILNEESNLESMEEDVKLINLSNRSTRYILVPVATIGCGKTTTALTLLNLFPSWAHIQNDNLSNPVGKKLVAHGLESLVNSPLVILDKNNHKFMERKKIFDDFNELNNLFPKSKVKIVCLNFVNNSHDDQLWNITENRVLERGDNHQSIKASSDGSNTARAIMKGFINRFQPLNPAKSPDSLFDIVIDLQVNSADSSLKNATTIIDTLAQLDSNLISEIPTGDQIKEAYQKALDYKPVFHKVISNSNKKKTPKPQYFGISVPTDELLAAVEQVFSSTTHMVDDSFWNTLKDTDRVQKSFHITIFHSSSRNADPRLKGLWNSYCGNIFKDDITAIGSSFLKGDIDLIKEKMVILPSKTNASVQLKGIYWNDKVMCILVDNLRIYDQFGQPMPAIDTANKYLHITLGTVSSEIRAKESNQLLCDIFDFGDDIDEICSKIGAHHAEFDGEIVIGNLPLFISYP